MPDSSKMDQSTHTTTSTAIPVTLVEKDGKYHIMREGKPYFIRGAGVDLEHGDLELLAASGGNSLRTWDDKDAPEILDRAHELGLTVMMGIWLSPERHGFDYDNKEAVQKQKERIRQQVLKYKDHPALIAWGAGNEVDLMYTNTNVWYAVEDVVQMIKELDPHHLVTTVTADIDEEKARLIMERVPSIDYLSVNKYGGMEVIPENLLKAGWKGPFAITEWGPTGFWEIARTEWDVPIEQTSTEKAAVYRKRYEEGVLGAPNRSLGSYAFLWGQKQETTPTWFGMFLESGAATEMVDVMQKMWTGTWPEHRAPSIQSFTIDGRNAYDNVYVKPGKIYTATVESSHPTDEPYTYRWEFLPESTDIKAGGDPESRPTTLKSLMIENKNNGILKFKAPEKEGAYRLFIYLETPHHRAATANIPFFVRAE